MQKNVKIPIEAGIYLIELLRCTVAGTKPKQKPEECTWEQVYQLAVRNHVESLSWLSAEKRKTEIEASLAETWKEQRERTLLRQLSFGVERDVVLEKLREHEIAYLPLKGILMENYYPEPGTRFMADQDILYAYTEETQKIIVQIMKELGYDVVLLKNLHDIYEKKPFYNFEMHKSLNFQQEALQKYYENPWERAVRNADCEWEYHFSDEDEYVYMTAHHFKHFSGSGSGIRTLLDVYYFLRCKGARLDWDYVQRQLEEIGMTDYEKRMREVADRVFAVSPEQEISEEDQAFLLYMIGCGTYGNVKERMVISLKSKDEKDIRQAKKKYLYHRFILPMEKVREVYPFFYKHRWLLWMLPGYRVVKGIIIHPKKLIFELRTLIRIKYK